MVNESNEVSRSTELYADEILGGPEYDSVADAPNEEGLVFWVNGSGDDPAGYYSRTNSQVSGPFGGPSNLPDIEEAGALIEENAEIISFGDGGYLTATADPSGAKRATAEVDIAAFDDRYHRDQTDGFDLHPPTDPSADPPRGPTGWRFIGSGGSNDIEGGWFYTDTPAAAPHSSRSFGADFVSTTDLNGDTINSGSWAIEREYEIEGGGTLDLSVYVQPERAGGTYDDGVNHDGETFMAEDDAFFDVLFYDEQLNQIDGNSAPPQYSTTAADQYFAGVSDPDGANADDLDGNKWVKLTFSVDAPSTAAYVVVRVQATDQSDTWVPLGTTGPNAAVLVDEFSISYPKGVREASVLAHHHDGRYINDDSGTVTQTNLAFDTATESELDSHKSATGPHHTRYSDSEAVSAVEASSPLDADISGTAAEADRAAEADHATDADEIGGNVSPAQLRGGLSGNGNQITGLSDLRSNLIANETAAGVGWRLRGNNNGAVARLTPIYDGSQHTSASIDYDGSEYRFGAGIDMGGSDLQNIGNGTATNFDVGGSPVMTADGSQQMTGPLDMGGSDLQNIDSGSATNFDVGGSPVMTADGSQTMTGDLAMGDNSVRGVETLTMNPDSYQTMEMNVNQGTFNLQDVDTGVRMFRIPNATRGVFQAGTNPSPDNSIWSVRSAGGAERLRVEHEGRVSSTNNSYKAGKNSTADGIGYFFGEGGTRIVRTPNGGIKAYDDDGNGNLLIG